jgi:hypothetical protein
MTFMTRKLYFEGNSTQHEIAINKYLLYLKSPETPLSPSIKMFANLRLHDLIAGDWQRSRPNSLLLPIGWYQIEFQGVSSSFVSPDIAGQSWLWHEIEMLTIRACKCYVIMDTSEFSFGFQDVSVFDTLKKTFITAFNSHSLSAKDRTGRRKQR